ncbi:aspartate/methionine/tyrosine aminotransferase [Paraburkholderia silvatlantica]|uniref:Aspartate/methionine/tyrosine aminotransferase n=1 Tax=Paraburkholderia silvatlantica TaxID=321895 RepID=A0ABR6FL22_9BURK|nr:aminotransferase class I/II-fold pyridoxal phosphate-dependent enzyme [Paraburkholderia silvatlantica]MBB2928117.1 aspartate/methionine/tyrosine aminotransferase [Paraburkholderia silvatlantica]
MQPVAIKLAQPDFRVNWDEVAVAINPRTRMIIVNTPHNPTATVFSEHEHRRMRL